MHDQPTPAEQDDQIDGLVLSMLCDDDAQRPWTVAEIAREIDGPLSAADAVARLIRAGLAHRLDGFVFATRAALHARRLAL
jgi:hypothetical protein